MCSGSAVAAHCLPPVHLQGTGTLGQGSEEEGKIQAVYPGQGQPLGAMQGLALQIRKLQKKQKGMAKELQAAAAREAFWRDTAQAAEQALDQVQACLRVSARYHTISYL